VLTPILTAILGLLVLNVLVVVHEFGHFWVARRLGVRVERFSIGIGPILLSKWVGGVEFALSAFPIGGYVKMGGDDPSQRDALQPGDLFAATWWRRIAIALAGPGANFLFAIVASIALLWIGIRIPDGPNRLGAVTAESEAAAAGFRSGDLLVEVDGVPTASRSAILEQLPRALEEDGEAVVFGVDREGELLRVSVPPAQLEHVLGEMNFPLPSEVGEVVIGTPAYKAGVMVGDRIEAVGDTPVSDFGALQAIVEKSAGQELLFTVRRGDRTLQLPITPFGNPSGDESVGRIGIVAAVPSTYTVRLGFFDGIEQGTRSAVGTVGLMVNGIVSLFREPSNFSQISGPVAIIQASGDAARAGIDRLLDRAILFSIALMVFNLLPVPILDGGMVFLTLIEVVRRQPVGKRGLALYQGIGLAVMGTLIVFVLIKDPVQIFQRQSAIGRSGGVSP
jgi:regulator of sigma E protease